MMGLIREKNKSLNSLLDFKEFEKFHKLILEDKVIHDAFKHIVFNNYLFDFKFKECCRLLIDLQRMLALNRVSVETW